MTTRNKGMLSAQVTLRSASGKAPGGETAVTSENVHEYAPASETAASAPRDFAEAGFEVGPVVGNGFSITGPASLFKKVFGVEVRHVEGEGAKVMGGEGEEAGYELPLDDLQVPLGRGVASITFTPPPDFGPTSY